MLVILYLKMKKSFFKLILCIEDKIIVFDYIVIKSDLNAKDLSFY